MSIFDIFTNQLLNGIVLGSFYALVALGYTMVFGVVKLLNFAHGELYMVGGFIIDSYRHEPDLMKVIIVEVTRAANSFGRIHLQKIREAYAEIARIVESARAEGTFKRDIDSEFAAMCFYGAIEQLLTAWIFELMPNTPEEFERAKSLVVEAICGGLEVEGAGSTRAAKV